MRKNITKSGQAAHKIKKYKYQDQLEFLKPHLQERDTMSNLENDDSDHEVGHDVSEEITKQSKEVNNSIEYEEEETPSPPVTNKPLKKRKLNTPETASSTLMKYLIEKNESKKDTLPTVLQPHPVDAFLASISPSLKSFSPYNLNLAKTKIFSIVQELEMNMILEQQKQTSYTTINSPSPPQHMQYSQQQPLSEYYNLSVDTHTQNHPYTSTPIRNTPTGQQTYQNIDTQSVQLPFSPSPAVSPNQDMHSGPIHYVGQTNGSRVATYYEKFSANKNK